jgi:hypothetical protein
MIIQLQLSYLLSIIGRKPKSKSCPSPNLERGLSHLFTFSVFLPSPGGFAFQFFCSCLFALFMLHVELLFTYLREVPILYKPDMNL